MEMILHGNKVLNVKFYDDTFVRTHGRNLFRASRIDHVGYVEEIVARGLEVYSVIILCEPLDSRLWKDSKYASGTTHLLKSQLEQDALDLMKYNDYYSEDEIQNLVREYDLILTKDWDYNHSQTNVDFRIKVKDAIRHNQIYKHFPELIDGLKDRCRYQLDKYGYEVEDAKEVDEETAKKQFDKQLEYYLLPQTQIEWKRKYDMPRPFSHWDSRNPYQQFYFIEDPDKDVGDNEPTLMVKVGGSGGSGTREAQGLWAHVFALLQTKHRNVETTLLKYTSFNEFIHVKTSPTFLAMAYELMGNYKQTSKETIDSLFAGKKVFYKNKSDLNYRDYDFEG